ncbi:PIG-L deacetylase family protein [Nostoc sp.]|uniref:PIG-L deacetylase family protein n=1 Tax=Nostoc sp. TaxID=1180 RepID=UPI002FFA975F
MDKHIDQYLFLSPHLDDVVFSCGGFIYDLINQKRAQVQILTVFAGIPNSSLLSNLAKWFHGICGLGDNAIEIRRTEDNNAAQCLGGVTLHMNLPECLYRMDDSGCPRYLHEDNIFQSDPVSEINTLNEIVAALLDTVELKNFYKIYIPLGIGHHIDHLLLRKAVEYIVDSATDTNLSKLNYYEDLPYACWDIEKNLQASIDKDMCPVLHIMNENSWRAKINAILCYKSQLNALWTNGNKIDSILLSYALTVGLEKPAERFWIKNTKDLNC